MSQSASQKIIEHETNFSNVKVRQFGFRDKFC